MIVNENPSLYYHLNASNTGINVVSVPCILIGVNINRAVNSATVDIYDHASSNNNLVAQIKTENTALVTPSGYSMSYNIFLDNGLRIASSHAQSVTVIYRVQ